MMPGPHSLPPNMPHLPNRRQNDQSYHYPYPPQPYPYGGYQHPPPYHHPPPPAPHYPTQHWYPAYPPPQPYSPAPRQFHPPPPVPQHHGPVIVSSHLPPQPPASLSQRPVNAPPTPPMPQSQSTPPSPPPPAPSIASVASRPQVSPATPVASVSATSPPPSAGSQPSVLAMSPPVIAGKVMPFYPELPWYSNPDDSFPPRARRRRRKTKLTAVPDTRLHLPTRERSDAEGQEGGEHPDAAEVADSTDEHGGSQTSTVAAPSDLGTPATSQPPSEVGATQPATPTSTAQPLASKPVTSPTARGHPPPAVPIVPVTPKVAVPIPKPQPSSTAKSDGAADASATAPAATLAPKKSDSSDTVVELPPSAERQPAAVALPAASKPAPKSWADLVRAKPAPQATDKPLLPNGVLSTTAVGSSKTGTLVGAIRAYTVDSASKIAFLEPKGLVNTGNMCYMNSILQVLVFCTPFYDFLDQVGKKAAHNFKSDTPLLDAMIMFKNEYKVIDAASSVEQLRLRLKDHELEQYGEAFIPEYVYDVIKQLPRFSAMRRGHQQDAEEFLGLILSAIHDECAHVLQALPAASEPARSESPVSDRSSLHDGGWLEVGPKQKAAVTRSSGHASADAPTTKIFGGKLRSELRVPGLKPSVTMEPYQPLQLAISSPDVNNIIDALKGLTKPETLHGDFNSPRGATTATKQLFIETLPPVLILHLKRFQYDNTGGAQKIWKKVGYPLDLTIPKEVFPPHRRNGIALSGLPKYHLIGVVYHHGKNANGGHYTVDVRRQDEREWIRLDDTVIRRIRSEDVAEGGAEEDPQVLAKALEQHKRDSTPAGNIFEQIGDEDNQSDQGEWSQVNASTKDAGAKKWSTVVNGARTPSTAGKRTPKHEHLKDNKVAYILFYRRVD